MITTSLWSEISKKKKKLEQKDVEINWINLDVNFLVNVGSSSIQLSK